LRENLKIAFFNPRKTLILQVISKPAPGLVLGILTTDQNNSSVHENQFEITCIILPIVVEWVCSKKAIFINTFPAIAGARLLLHLECTGLRNQL